MIVVADSGSSKTDWRIIKEDKIEQLVSIGLNPDFVDASKVTETVREVFGNTETNRVEKLFFYGSGSSSEGRKSIIRTGLRQVFSSAQITIEHDLLGAARAACGKNKGLAAILGTGSNCCLFDGKEIISSFRSGGFILGDEGGGVDFGKRLLKAYIENQLPKEIKQKFDFRYKLDVDHILFNIYKEPFPNRFLASFSSFIYQNKKNAFIHELIINSFRSFFEKQVKRYDTKGEYAISAVGSIAYYYHDFFQAVAQENNYKVSNIIEKPIAALCLYHQA